MTPVAIPTLENLSLEDAPPAKHVDDVEEDGDEDDEGDEAGAEGAVGDAKKKKKKKKCMYTLSTTLDAVDCLAKKKKSGAVTQSEPPRVGLTKLFKDGIFPVGQEVEYLNE